MRSLSRRGLSLRTVLSAQDAALPVVLVAETTGALVVPCAQIGLHVCVASPEFGMQPIGSCLRQRVLPMCATSIDYAAASPGAGLAVQPRLVDWSPGSGSQWIVSTIRGA